MVEDVEFGRWLRQQRQALGLTQQALANRIGYATETLRKLEAGRRRPTVSMLHGLSETLGLRPDERQILLSRYAPPIPSLEHPATSLPTPLTSFVGRTHELQLLTRLITQSQARLLTLSGPPGVGKTRLALAAASLIATHFPHGVFFVLLAHVTNWHQAVPMICAALGLEVREGTSPEKTLVSALRTTRGLLLLDGFDQVVCAAPFLARLLEQTQHLQIMVTCRTPLRIYGEQEFPIAGLHLTSDSGNNTQSEAVQLLVERIHSIRPDLALAPDTIPELSQLARLLDGLPLALELAAQQVRYLALPELVRQLGDAVGTVTLLDRTTTSQASFRTMLESYLKPLPLLDQQCYMTAGIFQGGWTLVAIGAIIQETFPESHHTLETVAASMQRLVNHGLITMTANEKEGEQRYSFLNTLRAYALDQLAAHGLIERAQRAHAHYFQQLVESLLQESQGGLPAIWLQRVTQEELNLTAVLQWAKEQGEEESGARVALALYFRWVQVGQHAYGLQWLDAWLTSPYLTPATRGRALYCAGFMAFRIGDYEQARIRAWQSLAVTRQEHRQYDEANALLLLALVALEQQSFEAAETALNQCVSLCHTIKDDFILGNALLNQGVTYYLWGRYHEALERFMHAQPVISARQDPIQQAALLGNMGLVYLELTRYDQALVLINEALQIFRTQQHQADVAYATLNLGYGAALQGEWQRAEQLIREGLALLQTLGDAGTLPEVNQTLAYMAYHQGRFTEAWRLYHESLEQCEETGEIRRVPIALWGLGRVAHALEWWDEAKTALEEGHAIYAHRHHAIGKAEVREAQAALAFSLNEPREAEKYLQEASSTRTTLATPQHLLEQRLYNDQRNTRYGSIERNLKPDGTV